MFVSTCRIRLMPLFGVLLRGMAMLCLGMSTAVWAQSTSVVEWNFSSVSAPWNGSVVNSAVATSPVTLQANGSITTSRVASGTIYASAGSVWAGSEDSAYTNARTSLTPRSSKSLSSNFTLTPQASGDWSNLTISFNYQRPSTAPTKARAVLTWQSAGTFKRSYTAAMTLSGTTWTAASAKFQSGDTLPTSLASLPCLLEVYFWGTSTTPNGIYIDDLKLLSNSLTNVWTMTPTTLSDGIQSLAYTSTFGITDYSGSPIAWSNDGTLPPGLSLNSSTGTLAGSPTATGTYTFNVTAVGTNLNTTKSYTLTIAPPPVAGLGNTVFNDLNYNGHFDTGEGISGVAVQLLNTSNAVLQSTTTGTNGTYLFSGLSVGSYKVKIPASEFATGKPLYGMLSVPGNGTDDGLDDDSDENGIDDANPATNGIVSSVIALSVDAEPVDGGSETGNAKTDDNSDDNNTNLTVDFGFRDSSLYALGDRVFKDSNGNNTYDPGEGVDGVTVQLLNASSTVLQSQTTANDGRYRFALVPMGATYYVRIANTNFVTGGTLENLASLAGNAADDYTDHDDNGVDNTAPFTNGVSSVLITPDTGHGGVYAYTWPGSATASSTAEGGTWSHVALRNNYVTRKLDVSVTVDVATQNTEAVWMVIANGAATGALDATLAACYLANGSVSVTPYSKSPTASGALDTVITTTTYTTTDVGTKRTFRFTLDTAAVNNWSARPTGWKGIGFPFDAQGATSETGGRKVSVFMRAYADGAAKQTGNSWVVKWGTAPDLNIGTFNDSTTVPETNGDTTIDFGFTNGVDYGDWPGFANASQVVSSEIKIGTAATDADYVVPTTGLAVTDDNTRINDEDLSMPLLTAGSNTTLTIPVTLSGSTTSGRIGVWVDWNGDNDVADTNETVSLSTANLVTGVNNIVATFSPPTGTSAGMKYVRIRVTQGTTAPSFNGTSSNKGEVEDYAISVVSNYTYSSVLWMSTTSLLSARLETYNIGTGVKTIIGSTSDSSNHALYDLAWSPAGKLYGIEAGSTTKVFEVNSTTGALTKIGSVSGSFNGMVFNSNGVPYISSSDNGDIYSFNLAALSTSSTTSTTLVFNAPSTALNGLGLVSGGDLAWVGGDLYYAATGGFLKFYLYKVPSGSTTVQLVGEIVGTNGSAISGVYGLIGDGYGTLYAQAGSTLYQLNRDTAVATVAATSISPNTIYGGAMQFESMQVNEDFGDYSGFGQAKSSVLSSLRMGALVDGDSAGANATATTDDTTGVDDEDGVTLPASVVAGSSFNITVNVTNTSGATAYLNGWVDWNNNGVLTDAGEQVATNVVIANGVANANQTISVTVPSLSAAATVGVRFRITSVASPGSTGTAGYGEVEDYRLPVTLPSFTVGNLVFNDANNNGVKDSSELGIAGLTVELLNGSTNAVLATTTTNVSGIYSFTVGAAGSYKVRVTPGSTYPLASSTAGTDNGTDDNNDGSQPGGQGTASTSFAFNLTVNGEPGTAGSGSTENTIDFGFRSCATIVLSPTTLPAPTVGVAYNQTVTTSGGTAPYTYSISSGGLPLGLSIDSAGAITGTTTVASSATFVVKALDSKGCFGTQSYTFTPTCPTISLTPTTLPNASAYTDYAAIAATKITASGGSGSSVYSLAAGSPAWLSISSSSGQLSGTPTASASGVGFTVNVLDGNGCPGTRAYTINVVANSDFGDYSAFGSASSIVSTSLRMGATVDTEASATLNGSATGDDITGTDDEDGVTLPASLTAGTTASVSVVVTNTTGTTAYLNAWIDFNNNGSLADSGEQVITNFAVITGLTNSAQSFTITVPGSAVAGNVGARFRLTSGASPGPTGATGVGEVEDYLVTTVAASTLSIGNLVWDDCNNDGIKQPDETGLAGASVRLFSSGPDNTVNTADDSLVSGPQVTSSTGAYLFSGLTAGKYYVRVTPPASYYRTSGTPVTSDNGVDNDNNGSQPGGIGSACYSPIINLAAGTEPTGDDGDNNTDLTVDFGLWSGFLVGDLVWDDLNNDGVHQGGEPGLSAVSVQLMSPGADHLVGGGDDTVILSTSTTSTGAYSFRIPATGTFFVRIMPYAGHELPSAVASAVDDGVDENNNGIQPDGAGTYVYSPLFTLAACMEPGTNGTTNDETTIDFGLRGCPTLRIGPVPLTPASAGQPYSLQLTATGGVAPYTWSLVSGSLPSGIALDSSGLINGTAPLTSSSTTIVIKARDALGCSVTSGNLEFKVVSLALGNLVWNDTNFNGVHDVGELGVPNVSVELYQLGTDGLPYTGDDVKLGSTVVTASDGTYRFEGLVNGNYYVKVTPTAGLPLATVNAVMLDNGIDNDNNGTQPGGSGAPIYSPVVNLVAGSEPTVDDGDNSTDLTVDFGLFSGLCIGNLVWNDANDNGVKEGGETGINNVLLQLWSTGDDGVVGGSDDVLLTTTTSDSSGFYQFAGLAAGKYYVRIPVPPAGAPVSSGTTVLTDTGVDNDDNGIQVSGGATYSPVITLAAFTEPGSSGSGNCDGTIDFGFTGASITALATMAGDDSVQAYNAASGAFVSTLVPDFGISHSQGNSDTGDVPWGIRKGPDGNWYVAHYGLGNLRRITAAGADQGLALSTVPGIAQITQFGIGPDGNFYVLDQATARVVRFHGPLSASAGTPMDSAPYTFIAKAARDIAFGPDGNLYLLVLNGSTYQVERYNLTTGALMNTVVTAAQVGTMAVGGSSAPEITGIDIDNTTLYGITTSDREVFKVSLLNPALPGLPQPVADLDSVNTGTVETNSLRVNPATHTLMVAGYRWSKTVNDGVMLTSALISVDPTSGAVAFHEMVMPTPPGPANETYPGVRDIAFAAMPATAATICSIGSTVWNDANYDGVYQTGEPGIGNVKLELWRDADSNLTNGAETRVGWTFTDQYGHYYFNGLVPGNYQVVISNTNFDAGASLATFSLSNPAGSITDNQVDGDDNGYQPGGEGSATSSPLIALGAGTEPLGNGLTGTESAAGGDLDDLLGDSNGDMTVDFAFAVPGALGIGNEVFVDVDGNGHYDEGEGIDGVKVELYSESQTPGVSAPLGSVLTSEGGRYLFTSLVPGRYVVYIPASEFGPTGLLRNTFSLPGVQVAGDDNTGEDGMDVTNPQTVGVKSVVVELAEHTAPTDATGETGVDGDADNALPGGDDNINLTIDLGFYRKVGVGNLVFFDINGNGHADVGEGVNGVTVELYRATQTVEEDTPVATTTTANGGFYLFVDLLPGLYRLHIPSTMFGNGAPLQSTLSIAQGRFGDDDVGEDGLNDTDPESEGVSSSEVFLMSGLAPTSENGESGIDNASDDNNDAAIDLTVDFGFQNPVSVGNLVFIDRNGNGHYDSGANEGVDGVSVEIYRSGATPGYFSPTATTVTSDGGHYRFSNLPGGSYIVYIPAGNFVSGAPLGGYVSMAGTAASNTDDNVGEKGLDNGSPSTVGISSADVVLLAGSMPTTATGETGFMASEDDANGQDLNGNMTIDFGFVLPDPNKMGLGNAVYSDINGNGIFDEGEGLDGVTLRLYSAAITTPTDQNMLSSVTTTGGGFYYFGNLIPGAYYVVVAPSNFAVGGKLYHMFSLPGQGSDNGFDDDLDENGDDPADPTIAGVRSVSITLSPGTEPTDFDTELGRGTYLDADNDGNSDMTVDFGFYTPVGVGNLVFVDSNGNKKADANEGVSGVTVNLFRAGQDPLLSTPVQTQTTGASPSKGKFLFTNLTPGNYFLHIPPAMFASGASLFNKVSLTGVEAAQGDDNLGENGIDPADIISQGISTAVFSLNPGYAPSGSQEGGQFNTDDKNTTYGDKNYDLTRDFGFSSNVAVGNLVFRDINRDGKFTSGVDQGVNGVTVELWKQPASGAATLTGTTLTSNGGRYLFSVKPGTYFVKIPAEMFATGAALSNTLATTLGSTTTMQDDDAGQDASDGGTPANNGAVTATFTLAAGSQPTAATGETGFDATSDDVSDTDSNLTIDLGFKPLPLTVGNLVFRDNDANGKYEVGDVGIGGVTLKLFTYGSDVTTDTPIATTVTATNGSYALAAYEEGQYFVHVPKEMFAVGGPLNGFNSSPGAVSDNSDDNVGENGIDETTPTTKGISSGIINLLYGAAPVDGSTETGFQAVDDNATVDENGNLTVDFGFRIPPPGTPLAGQVRRTLDGATTTAGNMALPGVELNVFTDANGNGVLDTGEMTATATTQTDASGNYVIEGLPAGSYIVEATPLPGAVAVADTDGGAPDKTTVVIADQPLAGVDFVQSLSPDTFSQWQAEHGMNGSNGTGDNPDADGFDNLMEYALGSDPASGVQAEPRFYLSATSGIDAVVIRHVQGHLDLSYVLEGSVDQQSWTALTTLPATLVSDKEETLHWSDIAKDDAFQGHKMGYVRLRVELDADHNGTAEATSVTPVQAFALRSIGTTQTTLSMPLLRLPVYAGKVTGVEGSALQISDGAGLKQALTSGGAFTVEVTSGTHEGEHYDVDASKTSDVSVALKGDGASAAALVGASVVVRPTWTLGSLLPVERFHATRSPNTADRVLFYNNGAYTVYWVANAPTKVQWVRSTDPRLEDCGPTRTIVLGEGMLVQSRGGDIELPLVGEVRTTAWVETLHAGSQLVGTGSIVSQSPVQRMLTPASGFAAGDRFLLWSGDTGTAEAGTAAFRNFTLSAQGWISDADQQRVSDFKLLEPCRANYIQPTQGTTLKHQP